VIASPERVPIGRPRSSKTEVGGLMVQYSAGIRPPLGSASRGRGVRVTSLYPSTSDNDDLTISTRRAVAFRFLRFV
jgi:hypothetical protein